MKYCEDCGIALVNGAHRCPNAPASIGTRPVIVTTAHRGVFFGYAASTTGETIYLQNARLVVYWSPAMKGFMGLAATGPNDDCRIGPPADITLRNVSAIIEVTYGAVRNFEAAPWKP